MNKQTSKPAILSRTLQFLAAGGVTMAAALVQEAVKPDADWGQVLTMAAGIALGVGGGAYGRVKAQGPVTTVFKR